jgi:hypothetical protein
MALYIASDHQLLVIQYREYPKDAMSSPTWRAVQRFHTAELRPEQEAVRSHFGCEHILYAGSYEGCGCGFNFGREYPDVEDAPEDLIAARESVAELVRYVRESRVREIYSCWFGDEAKPKVHERTVTPDALALADFFFREHELLKIDHNA